MIRNIPIFIDGRINRIRAQKYRAKINAAIGLIEDIKKTKKEKSILGLIKEIRHCATLGSGIQVTSGKFYIGKGLLEKGSVQYLASCVLHDAYHAYHVYQFINGLDGYKLWYSRHKLSGKNQASIERGAIH